MHNIIDLETCFCFEIDIHIWDEDPRTLSSLCIFFFPYSFKSFLKFLALFEINLPLHSFLHNPIFKDISKKLKIFKDISNISKLPLGGNNEEALLSALYSLRRTFQWDDLNDTFGIPQLSGIHVTYTKEVIFWLKMAKDMFSCQKKMRICSLTSLHI